MLTSSHLAQRTIIVWLSVLATLVLWAGCKWWFADWFQDPFKYPAKAASLSATVLMCWCVVLSARFKVLEDFFGGLDKVYQVHKRLGRVIVPLVALHPLFLAAHRLPDVPSFLAYLWFEPAGTDLAGKNLGVVLLALMAALTWVTIRRRLAYHVWKRTHEWFGAALALTVAHVLLVDADIAAYPPLRAWMYLLMAVACACYVFIRFLYGTLGPRWGYRVARVEPAGDILEVTFAARGPAMDFKPSQFVYLVVRRQGITPEPHPYSIASGYRTDGSFKLGIRQAGDHTRTLSRLEPGDPVDVYGPYGRFSDPFLDSGDDCVFIGGGIGITSFIGMWHVALHSEERTGGEKLAAVLRRVHPELSDDWRSPRVALFYVCRDETDASFDDDIRREVARSPLGTLDELERQGHLYELHLSARAGRFTATRVVERVGQGALGRRFFLCGPTPMVESLSSQLVAMGVAKTRIVVEDFNLV